MKTLARISGLTLLLAVCCLGTRPPALWAVITAAVLATAALFIASSRLGYFDVKTGYDVRAEVVSLEERRALREIREGDEERILPSTGSALRGR